MRLSLQEIVDAGAWVLYCSVTGCPLNTDGLDMNTIVEVPSAVAAEILDVH